MLQSAFSNGLAFDPFSLQQDGLPASEVDVGRREVAQALMIAIMIVVLDEASDVGFEIAGQIVVFKQDAVLQGLMPALDLALGLRDDAARRAGGSCPDRRAIQRDRRRRSSTRCR